MSVVANVVCAQTSWIAYDGRASRNGEIISESMDKVVMINNSVCVGYTGTLELANLVVLNLKEHVIGISDMKSDTVAKAIEFLLPKLNAPESVYANFLVTGVNNDGVMASYTLGSRSKLSAHIPPGKDLETAVLCSNANSLQLEEYVIKHIRKFGFSSVSIKNALQEYIRDLSEIDVSINGYCRFLELRT